MSKNCVHCGSQIPRPSKGKDGRTGRKKYCSDKCVTDARKQRHIDKPELKEKKLEANRNWKKNNKEWYDAYNEKKRKPAVKNKKCAGCDNFLPETTGRNRRHKWCSDKCRQKDRDKKTWQKIKNDPELHNKRKKSQEEYRLNNLEKISDYRKEWGKLNGKKKWQELKNNPEKLAERNKKRREKWAELPLEKRRVIKAKCYEGEKRRLLNPEYKERKDEYNREWQKKSYRTNEEYRKKNLETNKKWREKYFSDPENRKKQLEKTKQHYRNNIEDYRKYKREHAAKPENREKIKNQPSYIKAVMGCPGEEVPKHIIDAKRLLLMTRRLFYEGNRPNKNIALTKEEKLKRKRESYHRNKFRTDVVSSRK